MQEKVCGRYVLSMVETGFYTLKLNTAFPLCAIQTFNSAHKAKKVSCKYHCCLILYLLLTNIE